MKRAFVLVSLVFAFLIPAPGVEAVVIELLPVVQSGPVGAGFDVDVVISGLGSGAAPSVGAFDLDVSYDELVVAPTGVAFGPFLGDLGLFEAFGGSFAAAGVVDLFETSFLDPSTLDALQPDSFVLATLSFEGTGLGTSPLVLTQTIVGDAFGEPLPVSASGAELRVVDAQVPVPEPGSGVLCLTSFVAIGAARGRRRR